MKKLSVEILKKLILEAINAGYHHTGDIIQVCEAEISYHNFCQAIAGLKPVIIEDNGCGLGYIRTKTVKTNGWQVICLRSRTIST